MDAQKGVDRDAPAESGTLAVVPGNTPISKDILRIGTILGQKLTKKKIGREQPHPTQTRLGRPRARSGSKLAQPGVPLQAGWERMLCEERGSLGVGFFDYSAGVPRDGVETTNLGMKKIYF